MCPSCLVVGWRRTQISWTWSVSTRAAQLRHQLLEQILFFCSSCVHAEIDSILRLSFALANLWKWSEFRRSDAMICGKGFGRQQFAARIHQTSWWLNDDVCFLLCCTVPVRDLYIFFNSQTAFPIRKIKKKSAHLKRQSGSTTFEVMLTGARGKRVPSHFSSVLQAHRSAVVWRVHWQGEAVMSTRCEQR